MTTATTHATTNSERSATDCPRYWLLRYGLRLEPDTPARPLRVGRLWGDLLDRVWTEGADVARTYLHHVTERADAARDPHRLDPSAMPPMDADDLALLAYMLDGYVRCYGRHAEGVVDYHPTELLGVEVQLEIPTTTPRGTRAHRTRYAGRLDKLVRLGNGEVWIVEHKTAGTPLEDWRARHGYRPQAATYAVLVEDALGEPVRGVVYDLARKARPALLEEYRVNKNGALSKVLPPYATREGLRAAIEYHQAKPADWYADALGERPDTPEGMPADWAHTPKVPPLPTHDQLLDGTLLRTEWMPFDPDEVRQRREEMYHEATRIRRWHAEVARDGVRSLDAERAALHNLNAIGSRWPRNGDRCYRWGRPCEMMALCQRPCEESLRGFRVRPRVHAELDPTTGDDR